jgi:hypothetical protein
MFKFKPIHNKGAGGLAATICKALTVPARCPTDHRTPSRFPTEKVAFDNRGSCDRPVHNSNICGGENLAGLAEAVIDHGGYSQLKWD